ncbi:intramembrane protease RasP/YluC [Cutibacterium acnes JCM 18918]|nr:intramembrane protease RasP/YluC [Cutibacterium acnes JCM 18918]
MPGGFAGDSCSRSAGWNRLLRLIILSVLLHECGHFIPAKIFGVKVTEFFAGFGPKIWSFTPGETEYGFKWIPLGGYVRLIGMYPAKVHHRHSNRLPDLLMRRVLLRSRASQTPIKVGFSVTSRCGSASSS